MKLEPLEEKQDKIRLLHLTCVLLGTVLSSDLASDMVSTPSVRAAVW